MANVNAPFGFSPVGDLSAANYNGALARVWIPSTDNTAYYIGDAVKSLANADATGVSGVIIAGGTDTVRGVIVGFEPYNIGVPGSVANLSIDPLIALSTVSIPASKLKDYYALIVQDPDAMFMVQGDATGTNQVATKANNNCSFTVAAPSPATNALSATVLTSSTFNTTSTLNVRILGLAQIPGNGFGAFAKWIVKFNQHELMGNTAGV